MTKEELDLLERRASDARQIYLTALKLYKREQRRLEAPARLLLVDRVRSCLSRYEDGLSSAQLSAMLSSPVNSIDTAARSAEDVRVIRWERGSFGRPHKVWGLGSGPDAPPPLKQTPAEAKRKSNERYRMKRRNRQEF